MRSLQHEKRKELVVRAPLLVVGSFLIAASVLADPLFDTWHRLGPRHAVLLAVGLATLLIGKRLSLVIVAKMNLALFAAVAVVITVDVAIRLTSPIPPAGAGEWAGTPSTSVQLISAPDKFQATHRYNAIGFRGPEVSPRPTTDRRIICIGDSWTEGIGATEEQTWPAVVQKELTPQSCEVINLGDSGSAPDRYLEILTQVGIPLAPTHAIVCLIPSDLMDGPVVPAGLSVRTQIHDAFRERGSGLKNGAARLLSGWTYLWDRAHGRWSTRRGRFWEQWDQRRDLSMVDLVMCRERVSRHRARELVEQRMTKISPACIEAARKGEFNGARIVLEVVVPHASFAARVPDMGIAADDLSSATRAWVQSYAEHCRNHQIVPLIVLFPEAGLVSDAPVGPADDEHLASHPQMTHDNSISELLASICLESNVKYFDCTPALRAYQGGERLFLRYDGHPTARAYEIAGRYVARVLSEEVFGQNQNQR